MLSPFAVENMCWRFKPHKKKVADARVGSLNNPAASGLERETDQTTAVHVRTADLSATLTPPYVMRVPIPLPGLTRHRCADLEGAG